MRTYYQPPDYSEALYGITYRCDHPVFDTCTLYFYNGVGFAVIQQRYDPITKHTWWSEIDPCLANDIYMAKGFREFFSENARRDRKRMFPTYPVRKVMWALRLPPLKREPWETDFGRKVIWQVYEEQSKSFVSRKENHYGD